MSDNQFTSPYRFVPLPKKVFKPSWASYVTHDIPFADGVSGELLVNVKLKTPLCIGGKRKSDKHGPTIVNFMSDGNGQPVIPGSSLKGALRSALEIVSFGKMSQVDEKIYDHKEFDRKSKKAKSWRGKVSTHDLVRNVNKDHFETAVNDLAELIFGYIKSDLDDDSKNGLRGRVNISQAEYLDSNELKKTGSMTLSSPKPMFYPMYLKQSSVKNRNTYMTAGAQAAGWKRYVVKPEKGYSTAKGSNNLDSILECISPEKEENKYEFQFKLRFHNLRIAEMAALVWVLRLGNWENCFHQLGHGKPYGFGALSYHVDWHGSSVTAVNPEKSNTVQSLDEHTLLATFEELMEVSTENNWANSDTLRWFKALSFMRSKDDSSQFKYSDIKAHNDTKQGKGNIEKAWPTRANLKSWEEERGEAFKVQKEKQQQQARQQEKAKVKDALTDQFPDITEDELKLKQIEQSLSGGNPLTTTQQKDLKGLATEIKNFPQGLEYPQETQRVFESIVEVIKGDKAKLAKQLTKAAKAIKESVDA